MIQLVALAASLLVVESKVPNKLRFEARIAKIRV